MYGQDFHMFDEELVHQTHMELDGTHYQIMVYCREDGRHFAKTHFNDKDIIINDGLTMFDALEKHKKILPLAITSRQLNKYRTSPI